MNKVLTHLNSIPKDKWQHFCMGFIIAPWPFLLFNFLFSFWAGLLASVIAVVVIAKAKEIYDSKHGGVFDWMDFFATVAGGVFHWLSLMVSYWIS